MITGITIALMLLLGFAAAMLAKGLQNADSALTRLERRVESHSERITKAAFQTEMNKSVLTSMSREIGALRGEFADERARMRAATLASEAGISTEGRTERAASVNGWPLVKTEDGLAIAKLNPKFMQDRCNVDVFHIDDCEIIVTVKRKEA